MHSRTLTALFAILFVVSLAACDTTDECDVPRDGILLGEDTVVGTGLAIASTADSIALYYVGTLENGNLFDSHTQQNDDPVVFLLSDLIEGWKQGLIGMREGGRRKLTIPPSLGYGCQETRNIPSNSTLIFDIILERVVRGQPTNNPNNLAN